MTAVSTKTRLTFVDGLRGVAASMVVAAHLLGRVEGELLPASLAWLVPYGALGVAIFFVLSGFVIAMSVGGARITPRYIGRFALRRAIRLDPPYWVSIVAALILAAIAARLFAVEKTFPPPAHVAAHLLYLQNLLGYGDIIDVYWTLCLEFQFYLFLLLTLWAVQSADRGGSTPAIIDGTASRVLLLMLLVVSLGQVNDVWHLVPRGTFVPYWFCFTLGAMTYWAFAGWLSARMLGVSAALVLLSGMLFANAWCVTAAVTSALLYAAGRGNGMTRWLSGRAIQFLGRISYSLYLFHAIVGWSAMSVALRFLPAPMTAVTALAAALVGVGASIFSAWLVYLAIERKSVDISRRIALTPKAAARATPVLPSADFSLPG